MARTGQAQVHRDDPVEDAYDCWAPSYDTMPNPTRDLDAEQLRLDLAGQPLGQILELGCGTGKNTRWLVHNGTVTGLDFSRGMLDRCRRVAPEARLHRADLHAPWPVPDATMDTLLFNLVLEHIEDLAHVAAESARVTRPGGRVRISELHPMRQQQGSRAHFVLGGQRIQPTAIHHTTENYLHAFQRAGFTLVKHTTARTSTADPSQPPRLLILTFHRTPVRVAGHPGP